MISYLILSEVFLLCLTALFLLPLKTMLTPSPLGMDSDSMANIKAVSEP